MANSQIELKVLGQKLVLKSDADAERSRRAVDWITQRVTMIEKRLRATSKTSVIPPLHVALLALLEIGQEYLDAKDRMEKHQAEMNQIAKALMKELREPKEMATSSAPGLRIQKEVKKKARRGSGSANGASV